MCKEKVSYLGKKVFIGIDVHKKFYMLSAVCEGQLVKRSRISADAGESINFIRKYFPDGDITTCYEAGFSGFALHRQLSAAGINNLVVHAASVEVSSRDRVKTDKRDSKKLASHLSNGNLHSIRIPSEEEELFRLLARTREQLSRAITRVRIQIRMKLHQFGLMDPNDDRVLTRKTVNSILLQDIPCELKVSIKLLLLTWENLLLQKRSLEKNLYERIENDPVTTKWRRIVGMGPTSSIVLSSELGDMKQFANERSLFSFTGLTPSEYSSGEKVRRGHISRQGSARLRHTLVEAAWRAIRKDEALNAAYQRIAMRRGKTIAIVAIARKLVGRARAVFLSGQEYELNYSQTVAV